MAPKPPGRPSAKDIPDLDMLSAIETYTRIGAPFPTEQFNIRFPKNVAAAKVAKLRKRGLVDDKLRITREGRTELETLIEKAEA